MDSTSGYSDPRRVVEQGYDRVAHEYAHLEGAAQWPRMRWLGDLLSRLESGSSVLDLGCGSGDPADVEIARQHQITGVDISQVQIDLARQNVPAGHFLHADIGSVEFPPSPFDAVVSFYTLEHLPRQEHAAILRRIHQWLKPGGWLLFSTEAADVEGITADWLGVPMFMSSFDADTVGWLVGEAGFELVETATEAQAEGNHEVSYLWVLAVRSSLGHGQL